MTRSLVILTAGALCAVAVAGCSSSSNSSSHSSAPLSAMSPPGTAHARVGDLEITGAYIPQPASPDVAAAYFTVRNSGGSNDQLTKVVTSVTRDVMAMTETDSGMSGTMTNLRRVTIPAHGRYTFSPGHNHLMLQKPTAKLRQGDTVTMTITFARAGSVSLSIPVTSISGPGSGMDQMSTVPGTQMSGASMGG